MYFIKYLLLQCFCFSFLLATSCKKDKPTNEDLTSNVPPLISKAEDSAEDSKTSITISSTEDNGLACVGSSNIIDLNPTLPYNKDTKPLSNGMPNNKNTKKPGGPIHISDTKPGAMVFVGSNNTINRQTANQQQPAPETEDTEDEEEDA